MRSSRKDSTGAKITCAIVFCLFAFLYIYCYQTPTLSYEQHVLSEGVTFYRPLISAIIITFVAMIIQLITYSIIRLRGASHALTYLPSALFLAILTCGYPDGNGGLTTGIWIWFLPVILIIYIGIIRVIKQWISMPTAPEGFFSSRILLVNLFTMIVLMLFVLWIGNGDHLFHRQVWAEKLLIDKRYRELAREGRGSSQVYRQTGIKFLERDMDKKIEPSTDSTLTVLRFIAMDKLGILADSLFTQPVVGSTASLMRLENVHPYLFSKKFLSRRKSLDYRLCALLVGAELDKFAKVINSHCNVNDTTMRDSLPQHYKEALILYQHMRSNPITSYSDPVLETDFTDMRTQLKQCATRKEQEMFMWKNYRNTYWFYYYTHYMDK